MPLIKGLGAQQHKGALIQTINRPGLRWAATVVASVVVSRRNGRFIRATAFGDQYAVHYPEGVLVGPTLSGATAAQQDAETLDIFCHEYRPGPGDVILDIGAGAGEEVRTFSRLVGPTGWVISVEAQPATFERLQAVCRLNGLPNVTVVHCAIADTAGGTVLMDQGKHRGGYLSATKTIDSLCAKQGIDWVDLLKMNIEGAEQLAIRGIDRMLRRVRHVAISCHDFMAEPEWADADPEWVCTAAVVQKFFATHGFELMPLRSDDPRPFVRFYVYAKGQAVPE